MKKRFVSAVCFVLALVMILCFTACAGDTTKETEPATPDEVTESATEADKSTADEKESQPVSTEKLSYEVVTGVEKTKDISDVYSAHFRFPEVIMDSEGAAIVNGDINKLAASCLEEPKESSMTLSADYDYAEARDILSVWIEEKFTGTTTSYTVYNLDLNDGSVLEDNESVLKKLGLENEDLLDEVKKGIAELYEEKYLPELNRLKESDQRGYDYDKVYNDKLEEAQSDHYTSPGSIVYLVNDGCLCAKLLIPKPTAGSYGEEVIVRVREI